MINHRYLSYFSEALSNAHMISLTPIKCTAAHFIGIKGNYLSFKFKCWPNTEL